MIFRNRPLGRLAAAALLASGVVTTLGAPAYAAGTETDLSLDLVGTKVAAGTEGKFAVAKITNTGANTPSALSFTVDVSKVDFDKVIVAPGVEGCDLPGDKQPTIWTCTVPAAQLPGAGETIDIPVALFKAPDLQGTYAAPLTVTIASPDDTNEANNSISTKVEFTNESGPDLLVLADDVKQAVKVDGDKISVVGDLHAGQTAMLTYFTINQGDAAATGVKVSVKLPKGVTFTEAEQGCEYNAARTSAVCTYANLPLIPIGEDKDENDAVYSGAGFYNLLSVGADVKAGTLTGGSVTVDPIVAPEGAKASLAKPILPKNVTGISGKDVDASDNTDGYAVIVAAQSGSGGGNGGGAGGGGGNDAGGLPVTGPQVAVIGGAGAAVLAAGGAMFLVARRRRVVLVTPGDEKQSA